MLLTFIQYFSSYADCRFFLSSVYERHLLRLSINFAGRKIKPGTLITGTFKDSLKGATKIALQEVSKSPAWYFNQMLLTFIQYFSSYADCRFFLSSVYERHLLRLSINFAGRKIKPGTLITGTFKDSLKGVTKILLRSITYSHLWAHSEEHMYNGNSFCLMCWL